MGSYIYRVTDAAAERSQQGCQPGRHAQLNTHMAVRVPNMLDGSSRMVHAMRRSLGARTHAPFEVQHMLGAATLADMPCHIVLYLCRTLGPGLPLLGARCHRRLTTFNRVTCEMSLCWAKSWIGMFFTANSTREGRPACVSNKTRRGRHIVASALMRKVPVYRSVLLFSCDNEETTSHNL